MSRPSFASTARSCAAASMALAASAILVGACGSRGPLEYEIVVAPGSDASVDATNVDADAVDGAGDARPADARQDAPPSLVDCGACITQKCASNIVACIQSPGCQQIFQCVVQKCFTGGAPDPSCLFTCAQGDLKSAAQVFAIFNCVTGLCGPQCGQILGGLGGLPGGGGGGGGGGRGGGGRGDFGAEGSSVTPAERNRMLKESFSQWPELCGSLD